jgi:predicted dehydrogenase
VVEPNGRERIGAAVIGYGYWGPNLARNLSESHSFDLLHICDGSEERRDMARRRYPGVLTPATSDSVMDDPHVGAVFIATPTVSHYPLAMRALEAGKSVFIEKPIASTSVEARQLAREALDRKLALMVDHTFVYTSAVRRVRKLIDDGDIGDLLYYDSTRINLGLFQHDVDVIWDLAVHDISILTYLSKEKPVAVSAQGHCNVAGQSMNVAFITLMFGANTIAHVNVNWLAPVKIRRTLIGGSKKMIVYDDLEPTEKIKIYDKGVTIARNVSEIQQMRVAYRIGDMYAPTLEPTEALSTGIAHFAECIHKGCLPDTGGDNGALVVEILEAASKSVALRGQPVPLWETSR